MRGFVIDKDIKLEELPSRLRNDAPVPEADSHQLLVDVHSASLNLFDSLQAQGKYQVKREHPFILGTEIAGVISKESHIPEGCNFVPGKTRVFGAAEGSYAEKVAANSFSLLEVPEGMSFEEASGLYVTYPTSYGAFKYRANLKAGEWVLVHAGAGGVGLCALQIAKAMGARCIATAGSEEKLKVCKEVGGAEYAINYRDKDWAMKVKQITDGHGVDVVYDPVGMLIPSLKCIAWNGRLIVVGFAAGTIEKVPANLILLKNCSVVGLFWGAHAAYQPEAIEETWEALMEMFKKKQISPITYEKIYDGLETMPEALNDLLARKTWGKVVVRIKADPLHPPKGQPKL